MTDNKRLNYSHIWENIIADPAMKQFVQALSRRDFIKLTSGGIIGLALLSGAEATHAQNQNNNIAPTMPNGVASGDVTQTSAVLWTRSTSLGNVSFEVSTDPNFSTITKSITTLVDDTTLPVKTAITSLQAGTQYYYRATDASNNTLNGQFRTPANNGKNGLRFGVSGDWRGELRPYSAIKNAPSRNLDFFVMEGDSIYADIPSIDLRERQARTLVQYRVKHNEVYSSFYGRNYWADLRAVTPILATIDDHEVTNDFAGGDTPANNRRFQDDTSEYVNQTQLYRNGLRAFHEYNPLRQEIYENTNDPRMEGRPKLYRYNTYGNDAAIIILDARSFRDGNVEEVQDIFDRAAISLQRRRFWQPNRTMLGRTQVEDLKRDILAAHNTGITWKFIFVTQPVQEMGWFGGNDRWEGFAPERTEVLQYIHENNIKNVVFVAADIHSTFVNNLAYRETVDSDLTQTDMFEISTGPVAFSQPTGAALVQVARDFNLVLPRQAETYENGTIAEKDQLMGTLFNRFVLLLQGLGTIGLDETPVDAELLQGNYIAGHTYGWTEFDIDADTQVLTVTTYGVPAYSRSEMAANSETLANLNPEIISQFTVTPKPV